MLVAAVVAIFLIRNNKQPAADPEPGNNKKKISQPVNVIPVAERPYMRLVPSADGHYVTIGVLEVKKDANSVDYEMEYQTGTMLQGFAGLLTLSNGQAEERKLFGSQSAGGAITYHEDIKGGTFLAQFDGGAEPYAVKSAWRYYENLEAETSFSSQDTKFTVSNSGLARVKHLIIYNVPGFPDELEAELLSDPYALTADSSLRILSSNFEVSIRSNEEGSIMAYDGSQWQEMETSFTDGLAKASGPYAELYILVKQ